MWLWNESMEGFGEKIIALVGLGDVRKTITEAFLFLEVPVGRMSTN